MSVRRKIEKRFAVPVLFLALAAVIAWAGRDRHICLADPATRSGEFVYTNRLSKEHSPYLLQHAHNPVDWYPWGQEAFDRAKLENKPIFLSIGYSTCHWCHVMERESFANPEIAKLINDNFVPIKVDREERPDVDAIYMQFVTTTTGSGGWPMTVFLTPDRKPFFGGTYFPPDAKYGQPGLNELLPKISELWAKNREKVVESANEITEKLASITAVPALEKAGPRLDAQTMEGAFQRLSSGFDQDYGGFGQAPKFPQPSLLNFLLHQYRRSNAPAARDMVLKTLHAMADGGIHDQLGGGFHRYSTDQRWFLPHFEKMLYDQAHLADSFLDAYQLTRDATYATLARDILDYVLRDMTGADGQFYSAEDADSAPDPAKPNAKREGAFYVWTAKELRDLLADGHGVFAYRYGVEDAGNVKADPHGEFPDQNVLFIAHTIVETAKTFNLTVEQAQATIDEAKKSLLAARNKRPRPHLDDKTLVAWNGLMIGAFARAGVILNDPRYTHAAIKASDFIARHLYDPKTLTLLRRWRDGHADVPGMLDDYAFYIHGLLNLYESSLDIRWLTFAIDLQHKQDELFWDEKAGGYFATAGKDASLLLRLKDFADNAEPSGNSIAALNLLRLGQMLDEASFTTRAEQLLAAAAAEIASSPTAAPQLLAAVDFHLDKPRQIVIAARPDSVDARAMLGVVYSVYLPNKIVLGADGGAGQAFLASKVEFLRDVKMFNGQATAYVCENFTCQAPTSDPTRLAEILGRKK